MLCHFTFESQTGLPVKTYPANPEEGFSFFLRGRLHTELPELAKTENRAAAAIFGLPDRRQNFTIPSDFMLLHAWFQPGALFKFLRIPMTDLLHQAIDAELIWGRDIRSLHDQLANTPDYDALPRILDAFFWKKANQLKNDRRSVDEIGRAIFDNPGGFNLDKMAANACLSHRAFERRFMQQIGVTPKYFARICRFWKAFQLKESQPDLDWLSVAVLNGYTDYQHLVRDFRQFAGTTPVSLMQQSSQDPEQLLKIRPEFRY
jgi:AraC-like DNA-binding protein